MKVRPAGHGRVARRQLKAWRGVASEVGLGAGVPPAGALRLPGECTGSAWRSVWNLVTPCRFSAAPHSSVRSLTAAPGASGLTSTRIHLSYSRGGKGVPWLCRWVGSKAIQPQPQRTQSLWIPSLLGVSTSGSGLHGFPSPGIQTVFIPLSLLCCLSGPLVKK